MVLRLWIRFFGNWGFAGAQQIAQKGQPHTLLRRREEGRGWNKKSTYLPCKCQRTSSTNHLIVSEHYERYGSKENWFIYISTISSKTSTMRVFSILLVYQGFDFPIGPTITSFGRQTWVCEGFLLKNNGKNQKNKILSLFHFAIFPRNKIPTLLQNKLCLAPKKKKKEKKRKERKRKEKKRKEKKKKKRKEKKRR